MNGITIGIGCVIVGYGLFSGIMRFVKPSMFRKLEPMKARLGPAAGSVIHFIGYVVVPVMVGIYFIVAGISGMSFLDF